MRQRAGSDRGLTHEEAKEDYPRRIRPFEGPTGHGNRTRGVQEGCVETLMPKGEGRSTDLRGGTRGEPAAARHVSTGYT